MSPRRKRKIGAAVFALVFVMSVSVFLYPDWVVTLLAKHSPQVAYFVETEEPFVALTIDDGPDGAATSKILDVLDQHGARATFFLVTNRIPGNENIVRRIVEEEHELANHLIADEPSILLPPLEFEEQLLEAHNALSEFSPVSLPVHWFRPGSGWYNNTML